MFELWNAIKLGRDHCDIQIILAPEDKKAFHDRINADGSDARAIDEALANVKSEEAEAFSQDDLCRIHTFIRSLPGGFATLDSTIKHHLRRWFVSQGGVAVVARQGTATRRARPARDAGRVERVRVAQFADAVSPASRGSGNVTTSPPNASSTAAGDPVVSMFVGNPAYSMSDPEAVIATHRSPLISTLTPRSAAIGPSRPSGPEAVRLLDTTAGATNEDNLPAASAIAFPGIGSSVGRHCRGDSADGGYMEVSGTLLSPLRRDSDVSLINDAGIGRQDSDVSLIADFGIVPSMLSSHSEF